MTHFIDRRLNPKGKSLANRQRFLRRARAQIREAVQKSLKDAAVADIGKERKINISTKGTKEPRFRLDPQAGASTISCCPATRNSCPATKSRNRAGEGGGRWQAGVGLRRRRRRFRIHDDAGRNPRHFLRGSRTSQSRAHHAEGNAQQRAGSGPASPRRDRPRQINLIRTMRNAFGRRLALKRPCPARHRRAGGRA